MSSVSAYAAPERAGFTEDAPLAELDDPSTEDVTDTTYGGLKVLCERAAADRFGRGSIVVRPTYVVGPDDYTWRFPWWVERLARGGEVLAPGPADAPAQVIDVRDMAAWMVGLLEQRASGPFHAVSPRAAVLLRRPAGARSATPSSPPGTTLTWVDAGFLLAEGLDDGALPLWSADDPGVLSMAADPARATGTGLRPRPLAETVRDTLGLDPDDQAQRPSQPGLPAEQEADLLARWHARRADPAYRYQLRV